MLGVFLVSPKNTMRMALCVFECCANFMCRRRCAGEPERGAGGREWARDGFYADPESIAGTCVEFGQFEGAEQDWGVVVSCTRCHESATGLYLDAWVLVVLRRMASAKASEVVWCRLALCWRWMGAFDEPLNLESKSHLKCSMDD